MVHTRVVLSERVCLHHVVLHVMLYVREGFTYWVDFNLTGADIECWHNCVGLFIQSLSSVSEDTQVTEKSSEWAVVASCDYITNHMNIYCIDDYTLSISTWSESWSQLYHNISRWTFIINSLSIQLSSQLVSVVKIIKVLIY